MEDRGLAVSTSTGGSRRCAASTGSLTSTAVSLRTRPSTSGGLRCIRRMRVGWTALSWGCSCLPLSSTTTSARRWRSCSVSNGLRVSESVRHQRRKDLRVRARTSHAAHHRQGQQARDDPTLVPRTARTIDLAVGGSAARDRSCNVVTGNVLIAALRIAGSVRSVTNAPGSPSCTRTGFERRSHSRPRPWRPSPTLRAARRPAPRPRTTRSTTGAARTSTATPPTSSSPSSLAAEE